MKRRDKSDIHAAGSAEFSKKIVDLRKQITEELLKRQTSQVKNVHTVKSLRHKLAVVLTVARQKSLAAGRSQKV